MVFSNSVIASDSGSSSGQSNAARLDRLETELSDALLRTDQQQLTQWASGTGKDFLQFGWNRLSRSGNLVKWGITGTYSEGQDLLRAWRDDRLGAHVQNRYSALSVGAFGTYIATRDTFSNLGRQLAQNPGEAGPKILTMVLASVIVSGGPDADGGAPDLDLMFGIEAHRSIFSHSIIMGTLLETGIVAIFRLIELVYKNLAPDHDTFWDAAIVQVSSIAQHARIGSSLGMAYHLLIDGTVQAAAFKDLPISLPIEAHETILAANAGMETMNAKNLSDSVPVDYGAVEPSIKTVMPAPGLATHGDAKEGTYPAPLVDFSRSFKTRKEAERFLEFVSKKGASSVVLRKAHHYVVHYQTNSEQPLWGHRSKSHYSEAEVKFIRSNYLLWVPLADIARAIDRAEGSLRSRLNKENWRFLSIGSDYRRGHLTPKVAKPLFDKMYQGYLNTEHIILLRNIGVLQNDILPNHNGNGDYTIKSLNVEHLQRLQAFAVEYDRTDTASTIAFLMRDFGKAFFLARQADDMPAALAALDNFESLPRFLARVREVTRHFLRMHFLKLFQLHLESSVIWMAQRKSHLSNDFQDKDRTEDFQILAGMLKACLENQPRILPPAVRAYCAMSRTCASSEDDEPQDGIHTWVNPDTYRHALAFIVHKVREEVTLDTAVNFPEFIMSCMAGSIEIADVFPSDVAEVMRVFKATLPFDEGEAALINAAKWDALTLNLKFELTP